MRAQLDCGELRYAWNDTTGNHRASDDGGPLPPKGSWRCTLTEIDRERRLVRSIALFGPTFPMFFVQVFPAIPPPAKAKGRRGIKSGLVAGYPGRHRSARRAGVQSAASRDREEGAAEFRRRWEKLKPDDKIEPPVERTTIKPGLPGIPQGPFQQINLGELCE